MQLRISDGSTVFTYSETSLADDALTAAQEENGGEIEMENVEVLIQGTLMGAASFADLPAEPSEGYRAELAGAYVTVNGVARRETIRHDPISELWYVTVISGALDVLYDRFEAEAVVPGDTTTANVKEIASGTGAASDVTYTWYNLENAFDTTHEAMEDVDVQYQALRGTGFTLDVDYDDSGEVKTIERDPSLYAADPGSSDPSNPYFPAWNLRELFDILRQMLGWRVKAVWNAFPSDTIICILLTDRFSPGADNPDFTDAVLDGGYTYGFERADLEDFALAYNGDLLQENFLHASADLLDESAYYAADTARRDAEGRPRNADLVRIELLLPQKWSDEATDSATTPDAGNHPNYQEDVTYATPVIESSADPGKVYVAAFYDPGGGKKLVIRRTPNDPAAGQSAQVGEYHAANLAENYQMRRSGARTLEIAVLHDALIPSEPAIGSCLEGADFAGESFVVRRREMNLITGESEMKLSLPEETTGFAITVPVNPPVGFGCSCACVIGFCTATLSWTAPSETGAQGPATGYDIERRRVGAASWTSLASTTDTSYVDNTVDEDAWEFRVRSTNGFGASNWVYCAVECTP